MTEADSQLRDQFAIAAMREMLALQGQEEAMLLDADEPRKVVRGGYSRPRREHLAVVAYLLADEMMKARKAVTDVAEGA